MGILLSVTGVSSSRKASRSSRLFTAAFDGVAGFELTDVDDLCCVINPPRIVESNDGGDVELISTGSALEWVFGRDELLELVNWNASSRDRDKSAYGTVGVEVLWLYDAIGCVTSSTPQGGMNGPRG